MKLIEKKCPNCGAGLKFNKDDVDVTCEYCKKSYVIQRDDHNKVNEIDYELIEEAVDKFNEVTNEMFRAPRAIGKVITTIVIVVFIAIFFGAVALIGTIMSGDIKDMVNNDPIVEMKKDKYVTEISQIDEKTLEIMKADAKKILNSRSGRINSNSNLSEYEFAGLYLLSDKDGISNELYIVYSRNLTGDVNMKVYASVMYNNLIIDEDGKISVILQTSFSYDPILNLNDGRYSFVYGYDGLEDFYNKVLRNKRNGFNIKSTEGMYVEN